MKKIAVCGKGGSGKSVVTALLAFALKDGDMRVLVVDSDDSNPGLHRMLGFPDVPSPLIEFMGGKGKVEKDIEARIRSGVPEPLVNLLMNNISVKDIPDQYIMHRDRISFITVGKIFMALEGCACPLGIVSRSFLNGLQLAPAEVVLVDMEAGVEHFGRGVETGVDCVLVVVEPSLDSIEIAVKIKQMSEQIHIGDVWAVLNKIHTPGLASELADKLGSRGLSVIGAIEYNADIFERCLQGHALSGLSLAEPGIIADFLFP
ncbi:MAG: P-loop NTPase [Dehalococcoidia bacterium]|nr:P-loop NTPase [Dehalococcoidia bacterium]MDD5494588.1 P-loop NTPase [Dehalococcoidia bacterium]